MEANDNLQSTFIHIYREDMTFELNKFADLTEDEFRNTILMRPQALPVHPASK